MQVSARIVLRLILKFSVCNFTFQSGDLYYLSCITLPLEKKKKKVLDFNRTLCVTESIAEMYTIYFSLYKDNNSGIFAYHSGLIYDINFIHFNRRMS